MKNTDTTTTESVQPPLEVIKSHCEEFLQRYFGSENEKSRISNRGLHLICLGSPEKTIQGELIYFLRSRRIMAVSECGLYSTTNRRNIDVTIFNAQWQPQVAIELKHYSKNQGGISRLISGLRDDKKKHNLKFKKKLPLIQIGLYTHIESIKENFVPDEKEKHLHGFYRFIKTYCDDLGKLKKRKASTNANGPYHFICPPISTIRIDGKIIVTGRVCYCLT